MRWIFLSFSPYNSITRICFSDISFLRGVGVWVGRNVVTYVIQFPVTSGDMQTRRMGQFSFVLTLSPRLCAFLNKGIFFYSKLNSDNNHRLDSSVSRHRGSCRGYGFESRWTQIFSAFIFSNAEVSCLTAMIAHRFKHQHFVKLCNSFSLLNGKRNCKSKSESSVLSKSITL